VAEGFSLEELFGPDPSAKSNLARAMARDPRALTMRKKILLPALWGFGTCHAKIVKVSSRPAMLKNSTYIDSTSSNLA